MILVTGFGYQQSTNASGILVKSLRDELPEALMPLRDMLAFEVITCDETSRDLKNSMIWNYERGGVVLRLDCLC